MAKRRAKGEGGVYERKDGRWAGQYVVETATGPKRRYVYAKTRKEAAAKLRKAMGERDAGMAFEAGSLTVGEFLDSWLNDSVRGSVRQRTWDRYEQLCRVHIKPALSRVKLKVLTPAHLQRLYRQKLDSGLSRRTVQYIHATLRRVLGQAVRWGLIPRNVAEAVDAPRPNRGETRPLSPEQARAFLQAAHGDRYEALYVLALTTGLRQGELLGLRWEDVDLDGGELQIRRTLVTRSGEHTFGEPKTARGRRTVALVPMATDVLRSHRERQRDVGLWYPGGLVFTTSKGTPVDPQNMTCRSFRPLLKRAGLPEIRFHDLRHTAATLMLSGGVHPKIVQEILGHAQIS
ncbi:MAG TPA: site-specific integrase, partial [Rubrobacteraceae bacterium]|nr:site-specific integrase [Rubrobacteraceae bacterium]